MYRVLHFSSYSLECAKDGKHGALNRGAPADRGQCERLVRVHCPHSPEPGEAVLIDLSLTWAQVRWMAEPTDFQSGLIRFFVSAVFSRMKDGTMQPDDASSIIREALTLFSASKAEQAAHYMREIIAGAGH